MRWLGHNPAEVTQLHHQMTRESTTGKLAQPDVSSASHRSSQWSATALSGQSGLRPASSKRRSLQMRREGPGAASQAGPEDGSEERAGCHAHVRPWQRTRLEERQRRARTRTPAIVHSSLIVLTTNTLYIHNIHLTPSTPDGTVLATVQHPLTRARLCPIRF